MIELREKMLKMLDVAKEYLEKDGQVPPVAIFERHGFKPAVKDLDMSPEGAEKTHLAIQTTILLAQPDEVIVVSDAWMASAKNNKDVDNYERGLAEKQPDRMEVLIVLGGSIEEQRTIVQPYRREGEKIIFEDLQENEKAESAFFANVWEVRRKKELAKAEMEAANAAVH